MAIFSGIAAAIGSAITAVSSFIGALVSLARSF